MQFVNWPAPNSLSPHVWWGEGWGEGLLHSGFAFGRGYAYSLPPSPLPSPPRHGGEGIRQTRHELRNSNDEIRDTN